MGKLTMELYLSSLSKRYKTANKHEKGIILDELCAASGFLGIPAYRDHSFLPYHDQ